MAVTPYRSSDVRWELLAVWTACLLFSVGAASRTAWANVVVVSAGFWAQTLSVRVVVADGEVRVTRNLWHVRRIALGDAIGVRRVSFETRDLEGVELSLRGGEVSQVWTRDADGLLAAIVAAAPLPVGEPGRVGPERGPMTDAEYRRFFGVVGAVAAASVALFGWAAWDVLAR